MSHHEHRRGAPRRLAFAVLTASDSRDPAHDGTGAALRKALAAAGHEVVRYAVVLDERERLAETVEGWLRDPAVQVILVNGGTGISPRDVTPEALKPLLQKELPGFGEIFRRLSFQEIGSAAFLSRAFGGVAQGGKLLFALPGSTAGALLALEALILPEAGHLWVTIHPEDRLPEA